MASPWKAIVEFLVHRSPRTDLVLHEFREVERLIEREVES